MRTQTVLNTFFSVRCYAFLPWTPFQFESILIGILPFKSITSIISWKKLNTTKSKEERNFVTYHKSYQIYLISWILTKLIQTAWRFDYFSYIQTTMAARLEETLFSSVPHLKNGTEREKPFRLLSLPVELLFKILEFANWKDILQAKSVRRHPIPCNNMLMQI